MTCINRRQKTGWEARYYMRFMAPVLQKLASFRLYLRIYFNFLA